MSDTIEFDEETKRVSVKEDKPQAEQVRQVVKKKRNYKKKEISEERAEEIKQIRLENLRKGRSKAIENRQKKALLKKMEAEKQETAIESKLKEKYGNKKEVDDLKKQIEELKKQKEKPSVEKPIEEKPIEIKIEEKPIQVEQPKIEEKPIEEKPIEAKKEKQDLSFLDTIPIAKTKQKPIKIATIESIPVATPKQMEKIQKRYKVSRMGCGYSL